MSIARESNEGVVPTGVDYKGDQSRLSRLRHDLKNAINVILGYSEMWLEDGDAQAVAEFVPTLRQVREAGHILLTGVTDVLDPNVFQEQVYCDFGAIEEKLTTVLAAPVKTVMLRCADLEKQADDEGAKELAADVRSMKEAAQRVLSLTRGAGQPQATKATGKYISAGPGSNGMEMGSLLVVDDNSSARDLLARRLTTVGYTVTTAADGNEALELVGRQRFDLVLLDVVMPHVGGIEVLKRIRAGDSATDLPVIMVTARDESGDIVAALEFGANDYVPKPFELPVVIARI